MKTALAFTGEEFQNIFTMTQSMGTNTRDELKTLELGVAGMAEASGLNVKLLGRDVMAFYSKLRPVAGMSLTRIQEMAGAFAKLGIAGSKAVGMFQNFDTLEGGAEAVSKLTRSFGIDIDQMAMIEAGATGDRMKQLEIVRKAMKESGVEYKDMNAYKQKALRDALGMDEGLAVKALGAQELSSKAMAKAAKAAAKAKDARDMPKLLQRINKSIKKLADSFGRIMKPVAAFKEGFTQVLAGDKEFMKNWKKLQKTFERIGRKFGKMFLKTGLLGKITKSLATFAKKLESAVPLLRS